MKLSVQIFLTVVGLLSFSCSRPASEETFIKSDSLDVPGSYPFSVDMSDSLCSYDFTFYSRIDCSKKLFGQMGDIPVTVTFISPSGKSYGERVYLWRSHFVSSGPMSWTYERKYRKDVRPAEPGVWQVILEVQPESVVTGFRGMGLRTERKTSDERKR